MASDGATTRSGDGRMAELDDIDRRIVDLLQADGRLSMRGVAASLHVSRATVYNRVERLERDGVITGYTATVSPRHLGYDLSAYVYLDVDQQSWKSLQARLAQIPEVVHAALVSGEHDIVLLVRSRDAATLRDLVLNRLQDLPEVRSTQTVLIFDELVTGTAAPPPPHEQGRPR
jgi:DNA-binding Lrp family transcriptional regulator